MISAMTMTAVGQSSQWVASLGTLGKNADSEVELSRPEVLALAETLPKDTTVYLRIPHPISFLTQAKGTSLDAALKTDENIKATASLKANLAKIPISDLPPGVQRIVSLLIDKMESPIELAVIGTEFPPTIVVKTTVNCESSKELQGYLDSVFKDSPIFIIKQPFNVEGNAEVTAGSVQLHFNFDDSTRVLTVMAGSGLAKESLQNELSSKFEHSMNVLEEDIDPGRHGLFLWQDNDRLVEMLQKLDEKFANYLWLISSTADSETAFGWGTRDGHGHLGLVLKAPSPFLASFLVGGEKKISFASSGIPQRVFILSTRLLKTGIDLLAGTYENSDKNDPVPGLLVELSQLLGEELLLISDKAGSYSAMRVEEPDVAEKCKRCSRFKILFASQVL
jgi:hypothetical protein